MIREVLIKMFDASRDDSPIMKMRLKRIALFKELTSPLPKPVRVLDIGGTVLFWEKMGLAEDPDYQIIVLNISGSESSHSNIAFVVGDARDMVEFEDGAFDVAFSNSVIEHVGGPDEQRMMAEEAMRVGRRYFVQTPNRNFPFEPHFLFPLFQFFPLPLKVSLIRRFRLGWYPKIANKEEAARAANSVRLLNRRELEDLFPGGKIIDEKLFGLTSSFIVSGGW
ncbi:class I SAM-dependent methyltransferase [Candidatus Methanocrinis natronophilus]|uniref:Class I SAM-dependent methyltransferase n=1 Tax=Candidatus Methanocrinis natronophilus TaxID=3033396 RepID=A0ABT5X7R3_9EURY|nr:class I SAM-dependent methyltransferase [Candidatus Methanocrinis natronophilus]MDF0590739.1 class I SAM-dependent methyltransferase [Candidatus Methanocrinis natronophilus]